MALYVVALAVWLAYRVYRWLAERQNKKSVPVIDENEQMAYLAELRENRMIGNFVLTGAALPAKDNPFVPTEGYRMYDIDEEGAWKGGTRVIAAVSAEKLKALLLSFVDLFGGTVSVSIMDLHTDEQQTIDYLGYNKGSYVAKQLIEQYHSFLINNGELMFSLFSEEAMLEVRLDQVKHFILHALDVDPVLAVLHEYDIPHKPDLQFFPQGEYFFYNEFARVDTLFHLVDQLQFHEKKYYKKEA